MMLVVANEVSEFRWDEAAMRQKVAYEIWARLLYAVETDPMPCLDGRPSNSLVPPKD
jgi:hypothetical protein